MIPLDWKRPESTCTFKHLSQLNFHVMFTQCSCCTFTTLFKVFFTSHSVTLYSWVICKLSETILLYWKFLVCYKENVFLEWTILSTVHNYFALPSKVCCPLCTSKCWFALEPDKTCLLDVKNLLFLDNSHQSVIPNVWVY